MQSKIFLFENLYISRDDAEKLGLGPLSHVLYASGPAASSFDISDISGEDFGQEEPVSQHPHAHTHDLYIFVLLKILLGNFYWNFGFFLSPQTSTIHVLKCLLTILLFI